VTAIDRALAVAGRSYAAISAFRSDERRANMVMATLVALTLIPLLVIGLTSTPLERTFEELRDGLYRDRSSWLRLEGDLTAAPETPSAPYSYILEDPRGSGLAVTVYADGPLPTGYTDVTGRPLGGVRLPGTFEAFYADVPKEPARHDPWPLIALPAILALGLAIGERVGYPVVRGERVIGARPAALDPGEALPVRWSGRIGGESLGVRSPVVGTVAVRRDGPGRVVNLLDVAVDRSFSILPGRSTLVGRVCRVGGCQPGLEIHAPGADLILEFETARDRDRIVATLD
jgi:hypothetical protein